MALIPENIERYRKYDHYINLTRLFPREHGQIQ